MFKFIHCECIAGAVCIGDSMTAKRIQDYAPHTIASWRDKYMIGEISKYIMGEMVS